MPAVSVTFAVYKSEGLQTAANSRTGDGFWLYHLLLALSQIQLSAGRFRTQARHRLNKRVTYEGTKVEVSMRKLWRVAEQS